MNVGAAAHAQVRAVVLAQHAVARGRTPPAGKVLAVAAVALRARPHVGLGVKAAARGSGLVAQQLSEGAQPRALKREATNFVRRGQKGVAYFGAEQERQQARLQQRSQQGQDAPWTRRRGPPRASSAGRCSRPGPCRSLRTQRYCRRPPRWSTQGARTRTRNTSPPPQKSAWALGCRGARARAGAWARGPGRASGGGRARAWARASAVGLGRPWEGGMALPWARGLGEARAPVRGQAAASQWAAAREQG